MNITKWLQDRTNWLYGVKPKCQFLKLSLSSKFKDVIRSYNLKEFFQQVEQEYHFQDILVYNQESITIQLHDATNQLHNVTIWLQAWIKCQFLKLLLSSKFEDVIGSQNLGRFFQIGCVGVSPLGYYLEIITIWLHDATNWLHNVTIWLQVLSMAKVSIL